MQGKQLDALKGSIYMRMMGNEMAFNRFQGLQSLSAPFNLLDLLTKVNKDEQLSLTQSLVSVSKVFIKLTVFI